MKLDKDVFTTFEAARICNANISSIKNWIDKGELEAFRTPGGHYRIEKRFLDRFLKRHDMPNPFTAGRKKKILVVQLDKGLYQEVLSRFGDEHELFFADDAVDGVLKIGQWRPDIAVVDSRVPGLDILGLCSRVREHDDLAGLKLLALFGKDDSFGEAELKEAGATKGLPQDQSDLLTLIAEAIAF